MKNNLALAAIALVLLLGAAFQSSNSVAGQLKDIQSQLSSLEAQVASLANKGPRKFYLTKTFHTGAQTLSACDTGYHMASLWEIHDPTNLRYNTELGFIRPNSDSGFGPPSFFGWIRTGTISNSDALPIGFGNCNAWTVDGAGEHGALVGLASGWALPDSTVAPWVATAGTCDQSARVWCVQD